MDHQVPAGLSVGQEMMVFLEKMDQKVESVIRAKKVNPDILL